MLGSSCSHECNQRIDATSINTDQQRRVLLAQESTTRPDTGKDKALCDELVRDCSFGVAAADDDGELHYGTVTDAVAEAV